MNNVLNTNPLRTMLERKKESDRESKRKGMKKERERDRRGGGERER